MTKLEDVKFVVVPVTGKVTARRIRSGEVLESGDYYLSSNGNWEPCPCPGLVLGEGTACEWVRPISQ